MAVDGVKGKCIDQSFHLLNREDQGRLGVYAYHINERGATTDGTGMEKKDVMDLQYSLKGIKICRVATVRFAIVSQLRAQIDYLKKIDMNIVLVSSQGKELSELKLDNNLRYEAVEIPRSLHPWKDFLAFVELIKIFRKHKFDIVHSTTPKAGLLTALAAFVVRIPIRLHTFTGQRWVTLKGFMRWASRISDRVIGILNTRCYADSGSQCEFLTKEGMINSDKIGVIAHGSLAGVDLRRFDPNRWSLSAKKEIRRSLAISDFSKNIVFIGRIARDKGVLELISAFQELLRLDYNVNLLLIGPHDRNCGGKDFFVDMKNDQNIRFLGYRDSPEQYLAISDVLCLPSYREGFGTAVLDAAAMSVPTVGTRINGLIDAVEDGKTGILVPPRDDIALLNALKKILNDPRLMTQMGMAARQRCIDKFDSTLVNKALAEEYVCLLKRYRITDSTFTQ